MRTAASLIVSLGIMAALCSNGVAGAQTATWRDPSPHDVRWVTVDS